jgi:hypothetical protein
MAKYEYQMHRILDNIFETTEPLAKKNANNWICKMTNLVGGTQYQHAHADQAWPLELEGEITFPFVASHGFGAHPMQFWLLPKSAFGKNQYGFLHVLPPTAMLFMRGRFCPCRWSYVVSALPHEVLPKEGSRLRTHVPTKLLAASKFQEGHDRGESKCQDRTSFPVATL